MLKERSKVQHDLEAGIVSQFNIVDGSYEEQRKLNSLLYHELFEHGMVWCGIGGGL